MAAADLIDRAEKIVKRIEFHACKTLVFVRADGVVDSVPEWSPRAAALLADGAAARAGFVIVGVYCVGVKPEQISADAREALL